jgi:hypothetical protein
MPHAVLKLLPGVNTVETPALNENSGVSQSNLVRWMYDNILGALLQKLGGWSRFFPTPMPAVVRALWAWEDLNDESHLAVGTSIIAGQSYSQLSVITAGTQQVITPTQANSFDTPPLITPTIGSASLVVLDFTTPGVTNVNSVYIPTQIAVGGVLLFGLYPCDPDGYTGADSYTVQAHDILGNLTPATSSASPALPSFQTTTGSDVVEVTLNNNGVSVGITFPILTATGVGGINLYGNYVVQTVIDASHFTIQAAQVATSSATNTLNNGTAIFIYNGAGDTPPSALPIGTADWTMDNFGQDLVCCPTSGVEFGGVSYQPVYLWSPQSQTATVIAQAPPVNDGVFVSMPSRQIVTWGSTATGVQDPLLINWSDVNNPNQWIALVTNQAGSDRISKGSRIVSCLQGPQQALVWTDIDVWSMQYVGLPDVFSFNEIGTGCGLIARKAACSLNGIYYWMGPSQFYSLSSEGVLPIPCPAWDVIFQNLNTAFVTNIRAAVNSRFGEVQWFYPSAASTNGECDSYVKYSVYMNVWDYGTLGRSAWVDQSVLGPPIGADPVSKYLYQHETSNDADGVAMLPFLRTGYYTLSEGDFETFVDLVWPDAKWGQLSQAQTATLQITFYVVNYPGDTPRVYGPYAVTKATKFFNTRFRGRLVSVQVSSSDLGSWWRIGALRYRYAADGKFG